MIKVGNKDDRVQLRVICSPITDIESQGESLYRARDAIDLIAAMMDALVWIRRIVSVIKDADRDSRDTGHRIKQIKLRRLKRFRKAARNRNLSSTPK